MNPDHTSTRHRWQARLLSAGVQRAARRAGCLESRQQLASKAMVFAPHMDDETLGCGGALYLKRQAGAPLSVVFMTNGSASHARFMPREVLAARREEEACAALAALGIDRSQAVFLKAPDGRLISQEDELAAKVTVLLCENRPEQVFIPYPHDPPADHAATARIVHQAMRKAGFSGQVFEYPVWFWHHWPWVSIPLRAKRKSLRVLMNSFRFYFGLRLLRDFDCAVNVSAALPAKRAALEKYTTQMERLSPDPAWQTLGDVSGGEFLACFFRDYEFYRLYNSETTS